MPVTVSTGNTFAAGDTVTSQTLHDAVENATISGLSELGVAGLMAVQTSAPNPTDVQFWYDTADYRDRVARVYDRPSGLWLAFGPDRYELAMVNAGSATAPTGALVVAAGASSFDVATAPSINALGFLQAATGPDAAGPVCPLGIGWAQWGSAHSGNRAAAPGEHLIAHSTRAGEVNSLGHGGNTASGPLYGVWLEGHWDSFPNTTGSAGRAVIWGPRLTSPLA